MKIRTVVIFLALTALLAPVALTAAGVSSWNPVFSKDGRTLYFLSARDEEKTQLWSLNLVAGGEAQQVTELERGVDQLNFSSDEKKLLLVLRDEDKSEPLVEGSNPWVIDRLDFKKDAAGTYLDRLRTHIYIYDLDSIELTQITSGDFDDSDPAWPRYSAPQRLSAITGGLANLVYTGF